MKTYFCTDVMCEMIFETHAMPCLQNARPLADHSLTLWCTEVKWVLSSRQNSLHFPCARSLQSIRIQLKAVACRVEQPAPSSHFLHRNSQGVSSSRCRAVLYIQCIPMSTWQSTKRPRFRACYDINSPIVRYSIGRRFFIDALFVDGFRLSAAAALSSLVFVNPRQRLCHGSENTFFFYMIVIQIISQRCNSIRTFSGRQVIFFTGSLRPFSGLALCDYSRNRRMVIKPGFQRVPARMCTFLFARADTMLNTYRPLLITYH